MANEILLSQEGYEKLKKELEFLKGTERQRIAENIREAKSHGDLRENSMYHEAKLNQTRLESRIADLDRTLQFAKIVDPNDREVGAATLGSKVKLKDLQWDDELDVELVGEFEADPSQDKISVTSPLGAAIMDRKEGEEIEVQAPAGVQRYRVISVSG
jgi:transcription elongation factor GreA